MQSLLQLSLSNIVMALMLALVAGLVGRCCRRPALTHALWLLVLLKLVTPPLVWLPLPWPQEEPAAAPASPRQVEIAQVVPAPVPEEPPPLLPKPLPEPPPDLIDPPEFLPGAAPGLELPPAKEEPPAPLRAREQPAPEGLVAGTEPLAETAPAAGLPWPLVAGVLWLAGTGFWFGLALRRIGKFQRLLRHTQPAPPELQEAAKGLALRMGSSDCPEVRLVPGLLAPMLWSMGRATYLLMPAALLERLDEDQRRTLLAHELAHWRRRDHWVRYLELAVLALYWWLPLAWWARRELREAEEECCDAWVVWLLPQAARAYATALVETLDFLAVARPSLPPAASGMGQFHLLRRRVIMIMRGTTPRSLTVVGALAVGGLALLLLPVVPGFAQRVGVTDPAAKPDQPGQERAKVGELDKAKAELKKAIQELQKIQDQLDMQQKALHMKQQELEWQPSAPLCGENGA